jgi:hypothetical protein
VPGDDDVSRGERARRGGGALGRHGRKRSRSH